MEESTESIALYFSYNSALKTQNSALGGDMVGARGFEPPTSCSQSRRATGLRYAPTLRFRALTTGPETGEETRVITVLALYL